MHVARKYRCPIPQRPAWRPHDREREAHAGRERRASHASYELAGNCEVKPPRARASKEDTDKIGSPKAPCDDVSELEVLRNLDRFDAHARNGFIARAAINSSATGIARMNGRWNAQWYAANGSLKRT